MILTDKVHKRILHKDFAHAKVPYKNTVGKLKINSLKINYKFIKLYINTKRFE